MHRNGLLDVCPPQGHALKVTSGKFITLTLSPHTMESQNTIIVRMFSLSIQHPVLFHWIDGKNSTRLDDHCRHHIILRLVDTTVHMAFNLHTYVSCVLQQLHNPCSTSWTWPTSTKAFHATYSLCRQRHIHQIIGPTHWLLHTCQFSFSLSDVVQWWTPNLTSWENTSYLIFIFTISIEN